MTGLCAIVCEPLREIEMQRTERLFALTEYLRGRRTGVTAEVLAERFGVTVRTIYRDLDTLRAAALPLGAERGRGGGYALDRSYSLPPVNFTARVGRERLALNHLGDHPKPAINDHFKAGQRSRTQDMMLF